MNYSMSDMQIERGDLVRIEKDGPVFESFVIAAMSEKDITAKNPKEYPYMHTFAMPSLPPTSMFFVDHIISFPL